MLKSKHDQTLQVNKTLKLFVKITETAQISTFVVKTSICMGAYFFVQYTSFI